jgi:hypothetical protein
MRMSEYKAFKDLHGFGSMLRQHLYFGGVYDASSCTSRYYLHTLFTETANSILTIIWITLCHHLETKNPETLTITIDGKSTGMLVIFVCFPLFGFVFFFIYLLASRSQLFAVSFHGAHRSRT